MKDKRKASVIEDIFASAKEAKRKKEEKEKLDKEREDGEKRKEKRKQEEGARGEKKSNKSKEDKKGKAFVATTYNRERDDVDLNSILPRYKRKKTNEGFAVYSEKELRINQGGGTSLCPFDCNCCF